MFVAFQTLVLWLHLAGIIVWLGGLLTHWLVMEPVLRRGASGRERIRLELGFEARFRALVWPAIGLVLFTGLVNLVNIWARTVRIGVPLPSAFVRLLIIKLLLVLGLLILQAVQHRIIYPRRLVHFGRWPADVSEIPTALLRLQRQAVGLRFLALALAALVLGCALLLRR